MAASPLIIRPTAPASPEGSVIAGDGWWPDIDCTAMRTALPIGESVTHERLIEALESAMITVTDDLYAWRKAKEAAGFTSLAEVEPDRIINNKPRLVVLFTNAVRFGAFAELAERSTDMSATGSAQTRAEAKRDMACEHEANRLRAVRSILATTRVAVELI